MFSKGVEQTCGMNVISGNINPSRPDPGQREKNNLNFYFHSFLWCLKRFLKVFKAFIKPFEAPQISVKINI